MASETRDNEMLRSICENYAMEHKATGETIPHMFEHEGKYRFFIDGKANTTSVFEPCAREIFEQLARFGAFVHPCGGPRRWVAA